SQHHGEERLPDRAPQHDQVLEPYPFASDHSFVIPAKAGIQSKRCAAGRWTPAFAGATTKMIGSDRTPL
ncbi:MAG TPA: hypothetical protein VGQ90_05035, partial [Stellaceae bacterium]|nr:hypothetical protein [Stellaceae bacterium]